MTETTPPTFHGADEPAAAAEDDAADAAGDDASGADAQGRDAPLGPWKIRDLPPVTEREIAAHRRGLSSAYIPGGDDPDPALTKAAEDRYVRLLIGMVLLIVVGGFIVTFVGLILAGSSA